MCRFSVSFYHEYQLKHRSVITWCCSPLLYRFCLIKIDILNEMPLILVGCFKLTCDQMNFSALSFTLTLHKENIIRSVKNWPDRKLKINIWTNVILKQT